MSTDTFHPEADELRAALTQLLRGHPAIAALRGRAAFVLHGSTTIDIRDCFADWDVWVLTDTDTGERFERDNGTRFVEFRARRPGHFNVEPIDALHRRMALCEFELISELRHAQVIDDPADLAESLLREARKPMSDAVRLAWFRYHYIEMRGEHRVCDNAIERCQPIPLLLGITRTLEHALRSAVILAGEPYRYSKWLARQAAETPAGREVVPLAEQAIELIERGALRQAGPEAAHPINKKLKQIRRALIEHALASGIEGEWLTQWWLHMPLARGGIREVAW